MIILINASIVKNGGGLQVAHSFINDLRRYPTHEYVIIYTSQLGQMLAINDFGENFTFIQYNTPVRIANKDNLLDDLVEKHNVQVVFTVFGAAYWNPKVPHVCGFAKGQFIYKESPYFYNIPIKQYAILWIQERVHMRLFQKCNALVTENEDVSQRLRRMIPDVPVFTVTNIYHQIFEDKSSWDRTISLPSFEGLTLLTVSANYPHKNLAIIPKVIQAIKTIAPQLVFRFVLTIEPNALKNVDEDVKSHMVCIGRVHIAQCPFLYEQADAMFLPTLIECFSASYAEAMYMRKPVLTSDLGFARGLCGHAALYFDPLSPEDMAQKIVRLSTEQELRDRLVSNGVEQLKTFDNYSERTKKYLEIIRQYANK